MLTATERVMALGAADHPEYRREILRKRFKKGQLTPEGLRWARKFRNAVRYYRRYLRRAR